MCGEAAVFDGAEDGAWGGASGPDLVRNFVSFMGFEKEFLKLQGLLFLLIVFKKRVFCKHVS